MKKLFNIIVLMLVSSISYGEGAEQELDACNKANSTGSYSKAVQHAMASIKSLADNRKAYLCQAKAYTGLNEYAHALESLVSADQLAKTTMEHIVTTLLIGNSYKELKELDKAMDYFKTGLELSKKDRQPHFEWVSLNNIGTTLETKGDYKLALEHFLNAQKLAANDNERAESNAYIAHAYSALNDHDKAIGYQIRAALIEERSGDFDHYVNAGLELGKIFIRANLFADAEKTLLKVIENITLNKDIYWEAKGNYYLSLAKRGQGKDQEADLLLEKANTSAKSIGATDLLEIFLRKDK